MIPQEEELLLGSACGRGVADVSAHAREAERTLHGHGAFFGELPVRQT